MEKFWDLPDHPEADYDRVGAKWRHDLTSKWFMVRSTWDDIDHMTEESKVTQRAGMMDYEIDTRTMGVPLAGEGRIYPHNTRDITFNDINSIPGHAEELIGIDFGFTRDPAAAVWVKYDTQRDIVYVVGEWKKNIGNLREHAQGIWSLNPYCPVAFPRDGNNYADFKGGASVAAQMRDEFGVLLLPDPFMNPVGTDGKKNNHLQPGFSEINSRFVEGRLKIFDGCEQLINEINDYAFDSSGKPMKNSNDHLCDAFRYAVMSIIQGLGQAGETKSKFWYDKMNDDDEDVHYQQY